jgi:hypothetical protein
VRGAREARSNPAAAVPGIRADDRRTVEENAGAPPTPRVTGVVRGTMGKPQLPRRRAQEHIVPQLRGGPAPRQDSETPAGHDPNLMAAFQRGVGLAEAQQHTDAAHAEPMHGGQAHVESVHGGPTHVESIHTSPTEPGHAHMGRGDMDQQPTRAEEPHPEWTRTSLTDRGATDPHHPAPVHTELTTRPDGSAPAG